MVNTSRYMRGLKYFYNKRTPSKSDVLTQALHLRYKTMLDSVGLSVEF